MQKILKNTFPALFLKTYRSYFFGNTLSAFGAWMQRLAMSWLVYSITGSATWLGTVIFFNWFSSFLLMPWTGALLDTYCRRKVLVFAQLLGFVQAFVLALMTWFEVINVTLLLFMSVMLGVVNAFDMPGRQSFVSDMIRDEKFLSNAIATNAMAFNLAKLGGPAVAGFIVAIYGEALCFFINALSFLPFAWVLFRMKIECETKNVDNKKEPFFKKIVRGFQYASKHEIIFPALFMLALASLMGIPVQMVLLPVIADQILDGGAIYLGYLSGANGVGAVIGAIWMARNKKMVNFRLIPAKAFGVFGIMVIGMSFSEQLWLSIFFALIMGGAIVFGWSASNTIVQTASEPAMRSRVMSIYMMCFSGMSPIGSLILGWLASFAGIKTALIASGTACIIGSSIFLILMIKKLEINGSIYKKGV